MIEVFFTKYNPMCRVFLAMAQKMFLVEVCPQAALTNSIRNAPPSLRWFRDDLFANNIDLSDASGTHGNRIAESMKEDEIRTRKDADLYTLSLSFSVLIEYPFVCEFISYGYYPLCYSLTWAN